MPDADGNYCTPIEVDGEIAYVRVSGELTDRETDMLRDIVRAAKRKLTEDDSCVT